MILSPRYVRRGTSITEMIVALGVLGVVLMSLGEFAAGTAVYRRRGEAQRLVAQEASNFLEQVAALRPDDVTEQRIRDFAMAYQANDARLVDLEVQVSGPQAADGAMEQFQIAVAAEHRTVADIRCELIVWKHRPRSETP